MRLGLEPLEARQLLAADSLVISEFMASNATTLLDEDGDSADWIEVHNPTSSTVDLSGWYLTDDAGDLTKWQFPAASLDAGERLLVFASSKDRASPGAPLHTNFRLDSAGEYLGLVGPDGHTIAFEYAPAYPSQLQDISYGLSADGIDVGYFLTPSPGVANTNDPVADPSRRIVINEIMYHPASENPLEEYIELYNAGTLPVNLLAYQFNAGVEFVFPDVTIPPNDYLVVAANESAFRDAYPGVSKVVGGWTGQLSNRGEEIELRDADGTRIDRVTYADQGDWGVRTRGPTDRGHQGWVWQPGHDGGGKSLELIHSAVSNNYGQNWSSSGPDGGTPGAANSVVSENIAPLILDVTHVPPIPRASDPVTVTAKIMDERDTGLGATLYWRVDGGASFVPVTMLDRGQFGDVEAGDGIYAGTIPPQPDGTVIEFYVGSSDSAGNLRTWPAPSQPSGEQQTNALYQVLDSFDPDAEWEPGSPSVYYQIMTAAERTEFERINRQSDAQMNATFIAVTGAGIDVRYNAGVRIRGSNSRNQTPTNNRINLPSDRPWQGVTRLNLNVVTVQDQIAGSVLFRLAGLPAAEAKAVRMFSNGVNLRGQGFYGHIEPLGTEFARNQFPNDDGGNLYKGRRSNESPPGGRGAGLAYFGSDPAPYVSYTKLTNESLADWSDVINLTFQLNRSSDEAYFDNIREVVDIDQWVRFFAWNTLLDNNEGGLVTGDPQGDDYVMYRGVADQRFRLVPHDLDTLFGQRDRGIFRAAGNPALSRFFNHPEIRRRYYAQLVDLIENTIRTEAMSSGLDEALRNVLPQAQIDNIKTFLNGRADFVMSRIPRDFTIDTGLPIVDGLAQSSSPVVSLTGTADVATTQSIVINGEPAETYTGEGIWSLRGDVSGAATETLLSTGATWRYLDDGSDQGTRWRDASYDDSGWSSGPAVLGYGDNSEATVVRYIDTTPNNPGNVTKNATTYFRTRFQVDDPSAFNSLGVRLRYDDAAAVYINGVEAMRTDNLPAGAAFNTYASAGDTPDENRYFDFVASTAALRALVPGENVVAVEIHQGDAGSSDIKMDLALTATVARDGTGGIALNPGINRIVVEAFDGPEGTGNVVDRGVIDVSYEGSDPDATIRLPEPEVDHLQLAVRDSYLTGVPMLMRVEARDAHNEVQRGLWDAVVTLSTDRPDISLSHDTVPLYNGLGSELVTVTGTGDFTLTATLGDQVVSRTVMSVEDAPLSDVSGTLTGSSTVWSGIVAVTGDVTVPAGHTLSLMPGTLVLVRGDEVGATDSTSITVQGKLQSVGTADQPVTITAFRSDTPWGQIDVDGGEASFDHTFIHRAGNAPRMGHTGTGAAVRLSNDARFDFAHGSISDIHGKIMQSTSAEVTFTDSLLARAVMGPEIENTSLQFHDNWIVEMAGAYHYDGRVDDNDGIYLHDQRPGQTITMSGGVVASTQDDGIDTLGSDVTITDYIVRDVTDKAVSVFDGEVRIQRSLLVDSDIGVNTKGTGNSRPHTIIDHTTIAGVNFGVVAQDKDDPDPNVVITYDITNSIVDVNAGGDPVSTDYDPADIHISFSNVGEPWPGAGNINQDPMFANAAAGDFRLQPGSPSIDAADPTSGLDPDGSIGDQGRFANGFSGTVATTSQLQGTISDALILVPHAGPYQIQSDLIVAAGARLTILPGTSLYFGRDATLRVAGTLTAVGNEREPIRFSRAPSSTTSWGGIQFVGSMNDNRIDHAILEHANTDDGMIGLENSSLELDHVTFDHANRRRIRSIDSSLVVRNSTFIDITVPGQAPPSNNLSEHIWGRGIPQGGQFIIENNVFGHITGHNDGIDFDAPRSPNPIPQILNNLFVGGGDDALDMTGDVYIEGNVFRNYHKDEFNTDPGQSNVISASGGQFTVVRNTFDDVDHVALVKEDAFMTFTNNTVVGANNAALYFDLPGQTSGPGRGAAVDGSIFADTRVAFGNVLPTTELTVDHSMVPNADIGLGMGNLSVDPGVTVADGDYAISPSSAAINTGPNGLDMGALVPAGASVSGEPASVTAQTSATLTVGGPGITNYRYRVNNGPWSAETAIAEPIQLTNLVDGVHTVFVVGETTAGAWQSESQSTASKIWRVDRAHTPRPQVTISEVLAENVDTLNNAGTHPDLIELHNAGDGPVDLKGMSLSDDPNRPTRFVFTESTVIPPGEFLTLYSDKQIATPGIHLGFSLNRGGDGVYLYDTEARGRTMLDSVKFGVQIPDRSIARLGDEAQWGLAIPTFGATNLGQATGDPGRLRINEWLAVGGRLLADDFLELFNPDSLPVALGGLFLTDELGGAPAMHQIAPLSYVAGGGYVDLTADGNVKAGADHLNFRLSADQEVLALLDADLVPIDRVAYFPQTTDVSQGRVPNGGPSFEFFDLPTPGAANPHVSTMTQTLWAFDAVWKYDDSDRDLGTAWREPDFDDSAWSSGAGPLGFEEEPLPVPLNTTVALDPNDPTTYYFRRAFTLNEDPENVSLALNTEIDDGTVIYINGTEVVRLGMPQGPILHETVSDRFVNEAGLEGPFVIPSSVLVRGENVIAAQVHQGARGLTDIVFGVQAEITITGEGTDAGNAEAILDGLRVTEIMYNPLGSLPLEFIELQNTTERTIDLAGVRIRGGIEFTFPRIDLPPAEYVVVVQDVSAFVNQFHGAARIAGQYGGTLDDFQLNNAGERLRLEDSLGRTIQEFSYNDTGNWPGRADGRGSSLEIVDIQGPYDDGRNWQSSSVFGGTPGTARIDPVVDVVVNEVLSHTDPPLVDAIELYNTSESAVDVGGWLISDSSDNYGKFTIPNGTVIPGHGYLVVDESDFNSGGGADPNDFALSSSQGDDVWLVQADATGAPLRFADHVEFGAAETGVSLGRWPNGAGRLFPMEVRTLGGENSGPRPGEVILSEVHYHPIDADGYGPLLSSDAEFVELYNRTPSTIDLTDWRLAGGIDITFAPGTTIGPREALLVVPFSPEDPSQVNLFRLGYNLAPSTRLVGPYSGKLDNGGETIRLERPDEPPLEAPNFVPYILVDRVGYDELPPWPTDADGLGASLTRVSAVSYGDLSSSWSAEVPSPGSADLFARQAGDSNEDGQFDVDDVILVLQGAKFLTGQPATWREGDWNGDGRFDQRDLIAALQTGNYLRGPYASLAPGGQSRARDDVFSQLGQLADKSTDEGVDTSSLEDLARDVAMQD